ncbi:helicase C-terminal domain-containing protein [Salinispira pacifica]
MDATERILPDIIQKLRTEIADSDGNEVVFVGRINSDGLICEVRAVGHGDESEVPAPLPHMERGDVVLHNHPGGLLRPSRADLSVAAELGSLGIGSYIVDNEVEKLYAIVEPLPVRELTPIDGEQLSELLSEEGPLTRLLPSYEPRESQIEMLRMVVRALNESTLCAAEAGTGVGKSFAYLIPALQWAVQNEERVVVSTATINLQQQLVEKDIPVVKKLLGTDAKVVLVKGRGNYLCVNRLDELIEEEGGLFDQPDSQLAAIREWAKETPTGSKSDLPFVPDEQLWSQICSDAESCSGLRCRNRDNCFLLRARREAAGARLLVANHHLLFSDLAARLHGAGYETTAVLPPFQRIVFDEAHNIENSATSYFSESFSRLAVYKFLSRLRRLRRGRTYGLLTQLERISGRSLAGVTGRLSRIRELADLLDAQCLTLLSDGGTLRLTGERDQVVLAPLFEAMHALQSALLEVVEQVEEVIADLDDADRELSEVFDTRLILRRMEEIGSICQKFHAFDESPEKVFWLERGRTSAGELYVRFIITPLDIAPVMREAVYEPFESIIFTSATLTVNNRFEYWMSRVGLGLMSDTEMLLGTFPSPFPYDRRVLVGVPTDAPLPNDPAYVPFLHRFLVEALRVTGGRALVLFTSYQMLVEAYNAVKPEMEAEGISTFRQGEDERGRLLGRFKTDVASVLFATESFWEGVDAPGEALELVVICRLPFRVPTEPVLVARTEAIQARGGNPFFELSLPDAVVKLRQGFGRLMRRQTDRGVVLITDSRVVKKSYGAVFLQSLPRTRRAVAESASILLTMEDFLFSDTSRAAAPGQVPSAGD